MLMKLSLLADYIRFFRLNSSLIELSLSDIETSLESEVRSKFAGLSAISTGLLIAEMLYKLGAFGKSPCIEE